MFCLYIKYHSLVQYLNSHFLFPFSIPSLILQTFLHYVLLEDSEYAPQPLPPPLSELRLIIKIIIIKLKIVLCPMFFILSPPLLCIVKIYKLKNQNIPYLYILTSIQTADLMIHFLSLINYL